MIKIYIPFQTKTAQKHTLWGAHTYIADIEEYYSGECVVNFPKEIEFLLEVKC